MGEIIIPDTSLTAIVRDEMINPAGGVVDFIEGIMPHVAEGVVVDTGSVDGTREELERLRQTYPHLRIFNCKFRGFPDARNFSLSQVNTKYAFVLDADERVPRDTWEVIEEEIDSGGDFSFYFRNIWEEGSERGFGSSYGHNPRLFVVDGKEYRGTDRARIMSEFLFFKTGRRVTLTETYLLDAVINHFRPSGEAIRLKLGWYESLIKDPELMKRPLSETEGFHRWKKPNPQRAAISK